MARIFWARRARLAFDQLILSHSLPDDTRERVAASLRPLERFPRLGPELQPLDDGNELRFLIGPWRWLVLVYVYDETGDRVTVVAAEDGRAATTTIAARNQSQRRPGLLKGKFAIKTGFDEIPEGFEPFVD